MNSSTPLNYLNEKWFYKKEEKVFGPIKMRDLLHHIDSGFLSENDEISDLENGPWEKVSWLKIVLQTNFESAKKHPELFTEVGLIEPIRKKVISSLSERYSWWTIFIITFCTLNVLVQFVGKSGWYALMAVFLGVTVAIWIHTLQKKRIQLLDDLMLQQRYIVSLKDKLKMQYLPACLSIVLIIGYLATMDSIVEPSVNSCKVHTVNVESAPFFINGELDAGYKVTAVIENKGLKAELSVVAKLTSSEGDVYRRQAVPFNKSESKQLTYQFHEPTISATNVNAIVSCN